MSSHLLTCMHPYTYFFFKLRAEKMAWSVSACLTLDLQHHIKAKCWHLSVTLPLKVQRQQNFQSPLASQCSHLVSFEIRERHCLKKEWEAIEDNQCQPLTSTSMCACIHTHKHKYALTHSLHTQNTQNFLKFKLLPSLILCPT